MEIYPLVDWQEHISAGRKYLKTAVNGRKRPEVFTPELVYHLTAMAVEKLLVGLWQYNHHMPEDHTLEGLADGLVAVSLLETPLADQVKAMGRFDDMCPLVPVNKRIPNQAEILAMLDSARQVEDFVLSRVDQCKMGETHQTGSYP